MTESQMTNRGYDIKATLIPGDGIGPEICEATAEILVVLGAPFNWDRQEAGMAAMNSSGDPLPKTMLEHVKHPDLANKLRRAIDLVVHEDQVLTPDLGGCTSTEEFARAILGQIRSAP